MVKFVVAAYGIKYSGSKAHDNGMKQCRSGDGFSGAFSLSFFESDERDKKT